MFRRFAYGGGLLLVLLGILALTASEGSPVLPDERASLEPGAYQQDFLGDLAGVVLFALAATTGLSVILATASPAPRRGRAIALGVFGLATPFLLVLQTTLLINIFAGSDRGEGALYFTASYFFHWGQTLSFAAVYVLFFTNLILLFLILGSVGYLIAPRRFRRAILDPMSWTKNEAAHVAASLLLVMSLGVLIFNLWRLAAQTDTAALQGRGLMAQNLPAIYYLLCLVLFLLLLTVAAHTFLLNWGTAIPFEFSRLVENIRTIARIERGLMGAALALNGLLLVAPTLPSGFRLSESLVFGLSPRGFAYAAFLLLLPYVPYAITERRLDHLLRAGRGMPQRMPFTDRALRLVLAHLVGLGLLLAWAGASEWNSFGLMIALSGWTAGVLLAFAVRVETGARLPRLAFQGEAGPALYFWFLPLAMATGLMLWGSGNTFEVGYDTFSSTLVQDNASYHGEDLLARLGAVVVILGSFILTVDLWLHAYGVRRRLFGHYLAVFLSSSLTILFTFTVGVWTKGSERLGDVYAGFAFRQYYALESVMVGMLVVGSAGYLFFALDRMVRPILEDSRAAPPAAVSATPRRRPT